jgi:uncharacterized protein (DUF362 family)
MSDLLTNPTVAAVRDDALTGYPSEPPFGPREHYPEYPFPWPVGSSEDGSAYALVRQALATLGLDREHFGKNGWNPLGEIARPGDTVLIKPNWVYHAHDGGPGSEVLVAGASMIRPLLDYLSIAMGGEGRIIVADAPLQSADFGLIQQQCGMSELVKFWAGRGKPRLEVLDLRKTAVVAPAGDRITERLDLPGDPAGYRAVQLGPHSHLKAIEHDWQKFRVTNYLPGEMALHHKPGSHEYLVSGSVLKADAVICLAKLKTHRKGGITVALKNMVGINGSKDWLPHHREGSVDQGGDEYPRTNPLKSIAGAMGDRLAAAAPGLSYNFRWQARRAVAMAAKLLPEGEISEGSWRGNDTVWRMILDLNTVLFYAAGSGLIGDRPQRRYLALVDAVIAGEGEGPLYPDPRAAGTVLAGFNPVAVDSVAAALAGFEPRAVPMVAGGFSQAGTGSRYPLTGFGLDDVRIVSNYPDWDGRTPSDAGRIPGRLNLRPAAGWAGWLELGARGHERT